MVRPSINKLGVAGNAAATACYAGLGAAHAAFYRKGSDARSLWSDTIRIISQSKRSNYWPQSVVESLCRRYYCSAFQDSARTETQRPSFTPDDFVMDGRFDLSHAVFNWNGRRCFNDVLLSERPVD